MPGNQDTIVAIASAPGRGGIGVVRLSGERSHGIAKKVFRAKHKRSANAPTPQQLVFGQITTREGGAIDEGYLVHFFSPHSYTGEDAIEFYGHGSPVVLAQVVARCQAEGARLSRGGEFTQRAFLNGKMDLVQAEAVAELIEASSEMEAEAARRRLKGGLSEKIEELQQLLISLLAEIEAEIDFADEDLDLLSAEQKIEKTQQIQILIENLKSSYAISQRLTEGFQVALVGRPNVGKSSLFNALLQTDRAIVTEVPGTTRDTLREEIFVEGRAVRLIDTAGLHEESTDPIEGKGMLRSREALAGADVALLVLDATEENASRDEGLVRELGPGAQALKVWNKIDLEETGSKTAGEDLRVSAKTGQGMKELRRALGEMVNRALPTEAFGGISNDRHLECLVQAEVSMERAAARQKEGASAEFVAFELQEALRVVSEILGSTEDAEAVLGEVFSRFCVGK